MKRSTRKDHNQLKQQPVGPLALGRSCRPVDFYYGYESRYKRSVTDIETGSVTANDTRL